jgi:anti-anti-sigma factor
VLDLGLHVAQDRSRSPPRRIVDEFLKRGRSRSVDERNVPHAQNECSGRRSEPVQDVAEPCRHSEEEGTVDPEHFDVVGNVGARFVQRALARIVVDVVVDDFGRGRYLDDVEVFRIDGPFFFGAAARLGDVLERLRTPPKAFILRMGNVPFIDASGAAALEKFIDDAARRGTHTILCNVQGDVEQVIRAMGLTRKSSVSLAKNLQKALLAAREIAR